MRERFSFILLIAVILSQNVHSQFEHFYESWRWSHFTTSSGLPSDVVENIIETESGVPWVSTAKGLAWYDGYRWNSIPVDSSKPNQRARLISKYYNDKIFVILDGSLYQGNSQGFKKCLFTNHIEYGNISTVAALDSTTYMCVYETNSSAYVLQVKNGYAVKIQSPPPGRLYQTNNSIWFSSGSDVGLYRFQKNQWIKLFKPIGDAIALRSIVENDRGEGIISIDAPKNKIGVWEFQDKSNIKYSSSERNQPIRTANISNNGEAIIVYESGEIHIRENYIWSHLEPIPRQMINILSIYYRPNNDVWLASEKGLYLFKQGQSEWEKNQYAFSDIKNVVMEVFQSTDGSIWIGNMDGLEIHKRNGQKEFLSSIGGLPLGLVTGINQDNEGHIWICAGGGAKGFFKWDGKKWSHYFAETINYHKIRKDQKGNLWFLGLGVKSSDPGGYYLKDSHFYRIDSMFSLPSNRIYSFAESEKGTIWIGTSEGLVRKKNDAFTYWGHESFGKNAKIFTLAVDGFDNIWFSTFSSFLGTLTQNDSVEWKWKKEEQYEYNEKIWDLSFDDSGVLWLASTKGLYRYANKTWANYGNKTGANIKELRVVLPAKDRIFVGGHGFGVRSIKRQKEVFPLRTILFKPIVENNEVYCTWYPASFWGDIPSDEIETRYRINNEEWSTWSLQNSVTLKNLKSGNYKLSVQAKNSYGNIYDAAQTEIFEIEPIIFFRPIFLGPILLLLLIIIGLIIRAYFINKQHLINLESQRIRISNDLHDDVGSNLGSISLMSQRIGRDRALAEHLKEDIGLISDTAIQTAEELRDIVWYINPKHDTILSMNNRLREIAMRQFRGMDLTFQMNDIVKSDIRLIGIRRTMLLMYKEILHNIIKHSKATKVMITINHQPDSFTLSVYDNGVGFDHTEEYSGNGLKSLQLRADEAKARLSIVSAKGSGTTVTVVFSNFTAI